MSDVELRRVRPGDGAALRDVRLRALRTDPDAFAVSYEQAAARGDDVWEEIAAEAASGDEETVYVAEAEDGVFVAMVGAFTRAEEPTTRNLYGMWVAPEARGSGLGMRLVDVIMEWSRDVEADEVKLWVVETNDPAVHLYERAGFVPTGEAQPLPSNPALIDTRMRVTLT